MTAVAPPPNFQSISRWGIGNDAPNGLNTMSADEVSRMVMPRKTAQRSNSSSSLASQASSNSTISASSTQTNGATNGANGDWGTRKKPTRSLWPSKAEPVTGLSAVPTGRVQSSIAQTSGSAAASAISALHTPSSMLPSQNGVQSQGQQNGAVRQQGQPEASAILHLTPMNGTFERKTISVPFFPEVLRIGRQTNNKTIPTAVNGYFDSKVLSRQHAEVWADRSGCVYIRDVKSSNGTFVNGQRLSQENKDSEPHPLRGSDLLELGIDIVSEDQKTVVHHKVAAKVEHAGFVNPTSNMIDLNFGDLDPTQNGHLIGQQMGAMNQQRGRAGSQGSVGSNGRLSSTGSVVSNTSAMGHHRQQLWLQTVTMDQVVKKVQAEFKQAKVQKSELERATQFIETLLSSEKKEVARPSPIEKTKVSGLKGDLKARFSDPPAPPPQQPLPEKPDVARSTIESIVQPFLRRSDTERPKLASSNSSPVATKNDPAQQLQITSLVEALATAKKDMEEQGLKLKTMQDLLDQERSARESAEERAQRLEADRRRDSGSLLMPEILTNGLHVPSRDDEDSFTPIDDEAIDETILAEQSEDLPKTQLQQRLDSLLAEMSEMKQLMEQYRRRAETAEEQSTQDRESLAEMIEKIRREDAERLERASSRDRRSRSTSHPNSDLGVDGTKETNEEAERPVTPEEKKAGELVRKVGVQNGHPVTSEQIKQLEQIVSKELALKARREDVIATAAPYASIVLVVSLGYGLMVYLNGLQKIER